MWSGLFLILLGLLILIEPRILVAFISAFLVASGMALVFLHWKLRKVYRASGDAQSRFDRFIIRF